MTDFLQFKTCGKYRFCDRNIPNDADIVKTYFVLINTDFYSSRATFAVLPECRSCPCFFSGVFSLVPIEEVLAEYPIQTVIQLLSTNG